MEIKNQKVTEVLCSGGYGKLTPKECMECAQTDKAICGFDLSILQIIFSDNERTDIHVSDIVHCLRRSWYDKKVPPVEYVHAYLYRLMGTAMHAAVEHSNDGLVFKSEVRLNALGIVGTADIYYPDSGKVVDLKTTRWLSPDKVPYGEHATQIQIYATMMKQMGMQVKELKIQYVDLSGPSKCRTCKVPVEPSLFQDVLEYVCPKCGKIEASYHPGVVLVDIDLPDYDEMKEFISERRQELLDSLATETPPAQERSFLCNYCAYSEQCLGEKPRE